MKQRMIIWSLAVAGLLMAGMEDVQAQSREVRRVNTERRTDDRSVNQPNPERSNVTGTRRPEDARRPQQDPRRENYGKPVPAPRERLVSTDAVRAFGRESFDSNRLRMADMIFSTGGMMTVEQVVEIAQEFDYDSNRVKFLKSAYLNCVDRYNYYLTLRTLDYSSSRDKVIKYITEIREEDEYYYNEYYKISSAEMKNIIRTLDNEDFDSYRLKIARLIVNGNLFTARQIADMAKTFDFDSNRSEFLLYAYDNCVDPQNYSVAVNTLEFRSHRNEVMDELSRRRR